MATHSSVLAWRIPGMGEPDGLPSMGSHRVGHNWSDLAARNHPCGSAGKESPCNAGDLGLIPGLGRSPGEGKGCPSSVLAWRSPWTIKSVGREESDTTEHLSLRWDHPTRLGPRGGASFQVSAGPWQTVSRQNLQQCSGQPGHWARHSPQHHCHPCARPSLGPRSVSRSTCPWNAGPVKAMLQTLQEKAEVRMVGKMSWF